MGLGDGHSDGRLVVTALNGGPEPVAAVVSYARERAPAILESVAGHPTYGRWSVFACDPADELVVGQDHQGDPLDAMADKLGRCPRIENSAGLPFSGGWIGYVSYEAGTRVENVGATNPAGTSLPRVHMALYDTAALFDHRAGRWYVVAVDWPPAHGIGRPAAEERIARQRDRLKAAESAACPLPVAKQRGGPAPRADWSREEYITRVLAAKEYIAAGDIYQVNLTQRFVARTDATPLQLYLDLRRVNPSDYAALLPWDEGAVISSSPELFLDLHDGRVITRPIKGTRPRTGDERLDAIRRRELADSAKDRAELNMIIDLLRNDIGRVCAAGSIRVESAGDLEMHPTVFHRAATITGRLGKKGTGLFLRKKSPVPFSAIDLLRATCPGGSITGAPKIRAMQIIDELEAVQRGVYCGSIGYVGLDGGMTMNIAIRTMVLDRGTVHIHTGGAIVADSDPQEEYEETLAKAAGMFGALQAANRRSRMADSKLARMKQPEVGKPRSGPFMAEIG